MSSDWFCSTQYDPIIRRSSQFLVSFSHHGRWGAAQSSGAADYQPRHRYHWRIHAWLVFSRLLAHISRFSPAVSKTDQAAFLFSIVQFTESFDHTASPGMLLWQFVWACAWCQVFVRFRLSFRRIISFFGEIISQDGCNLRLVIQWYASGEERGRRWSTDVTLSCFV